MIVKYSLVKTVVTVSRARYGCGGVLFPGIVPDIRFSADSNAIHAGYLAGGDNVPSANCW